MDASEEVAPAVRSILDAARERGAPERTLSIDARSLPAAFERAEADGRTPVVAEVKPTSPTAAGTNDEDPVELAEAMVDGGAAALSVLTEPEHFGGSPEYLEAIRSAVDVPVLRKDFVLEEAQLDVVEADVVLLIARFVDDLEHLIDAAEERGFQVLVETHSAEEFETAIDAGAEIVGINNRDLAKLEVDLATVEDVLAAVDLQALVERSDALETPEDLTVIAESGIGSAADARRMRAAGADALLIGSAIVDHAAGADPETVRSNTETFTTAEREAEP